MLAVFDHLRPFSQFQLQQGVADNADSNVDRLDIVFDCCYRFLDILQRCVVAECLTSVVDLLARYVKTLVHFSQLVL